MSVISIMQVPISSSMSLHINFRNLRPHKLHMASGVYSLNYASCICICISIEFYLNAMSSHRCTKQETLHKHTKFEMRAETAEAGTTQESTVSPKKSLWKNWPLMSSIITYCVFSLHDTAYSEVIYGMIKSRYIEVLQKDTADLGAVNMLILFLKNRKYINS